MAGGHCRSGLPLSIAVESLLPTPSAGNFNDGESLESWESRRQENLAKGINGNGMGTPLPIAVQLLRTPTAQLAVNGGSQHPDKRKAGGHGPTLADEVEHLLPTPASADATGGRVSKTMDTKRPDGSKLQVTLATVVHHHLLPTPSAALATGGQTSRSGDRIGEPLLPSIARAASSGGPTSRPSAAGKPSSDAQHPGQLSLDDELEND
jgi:DNA (cytosine-5)-methyltransferase 1